MGTGPVADWTPRAPFEELAERPWPTTNRCLMKNTGHTVGLSCGNTWEARDGRATQVDARPRNGNLLPWASVYGQGFCKI